MSSAASDFVADEIPLPETSFKKVPIENVETSISVQHIPPKKNSEEKESSYGEDKIAWIISLLSLVLILGAMWIWGNARDWYDQSGYGYNGTGRFDTEPFGCNDTSEPGRHGLPDCTASWYFWKLPTDEITPLTRGIMWLLYSTHQIFIWALIYKAQLEMSPESRQKRGEKGSKYGSKMRWFNYASLGVNFFFHIMHLIQTHWTYDGISQDVSLSSSQSSVVLMISLMMLIEYRDRGIIFMWPNPRSRDRFAKKLRLNQKPINYIRKYHGYYFSWAIVYTFWYHPMENTWAHTTGFFHTGMLLIQGSLIFTDMHLNKYWRLVNESYVMAHGALVAVQTANPEKPNQLWPMFFFGFGFLLCFTQIFILPFWQKISPWFRILPGAFYYIFAFIIYSTVIPEGLRNMFQTVAIPSIQYANMILAWLCLYFFIWIENRLTCNSCYGAPSRGWNVLYLITVLSIYAALMLSNVLLNYVEVMFLLLMEINVVALILLISVTIMIHKRMLGPFRRNPVVRISPSQT